MRQLKRSDEFWSRGVEVTSVRLPPTLGKGGGIVAGRPANKQFER